MSQDPPPEIARSLARIADALEDIASNQVRPGICADEAPKMPGQFPLFCSLLAGHEGAHYDELTDGHWMHRATPPTEAPEPAAQDSAEKE